MTDNQIFSSFENELIAIKRNVEKAKQDVIDGKIAEIEAEISKREEQLDIFMKQLKTKLGSFIDDEARLKEQIREKVRREETHLTFFEMPLHSNRLVSTILTQFEWNLERNTLHRLFLDVCDLPTCASIDGLLKRVENIKHKVKPETVSLVLNEDYNLSNVLGHAFSFFTREFTSGSLEINLKWKL